MTAATAAARPSRRRALLPLATLLAAASIAMASGATFTSATQNDDNGFETGTLEQINSRGSDAIFDLDNLKPGDTVTGSVTITNSGSLPAIFTLSETELENTFVDQDLLTLTITEGTSPVASGTLGSLPDVALGTFAAGTERTFTFTAALDETAGNANQGKAARTTYRWDAIQTAPVDVVQ